MAESGQLLALSPLRSSVILRDMAEIHRVALVVAPDFGRRLERMSAEMHVWLVRSAANEDSARRIWQTIGAGHSLESGVTLFGSPAETPEEACTDILSTIDEHHGEHCHNPPLSVINVIGVDPTPDIRAELAALDFRAEPSADGFIASRHV